MPSDPSLLDSLPLHWYFEENPSKRFPVMATSKTFSSLLVIIADMKLRLIVERDPETGRYSSVFPELPGCASAGDTEDEAIANAREALELWFEPTDISLDDSAKLVEVTV